MTTRMLIDATHSEETRIVVVSGNRLEEFDFESSTKKQLKGNIYLAKVTRVEPSLQAAFVEYGGNRHGFLAFNEIHPDYYQIPVADREALLQEEAEQAAQEAALDDEAAEKGEVGDDGDAAEADETDDGEGDGEPEEDGDEAGEAASAEEAAGGDDALDEVPRPRQRPKRTYRIQEVIKKRQILLVQVVKEERGTKGAALTTYLSLAGRYCVLMPNTARGGGISRKIVNQVARRKLKKIVSDLELPEGMGVIVRTAGMNRTKSEIKRDFEYLIRLWDNVRELTMESSAPALVYEEANLIKRAIRDLYRKEIEEIQVDGDEGYRAAKDFMRMLLPSHAKKVQPYRDTTPLFHRYQIEQQLDSMHSNVVNLRSGGYLVINPTEALVAVDVNSGRSTKEHNIEETALKTNLEAAEEVARQLRLRDLAGLVVIDFIDMEVNRNNRAVERRIKECLKSDRARIQVGRISTFGLLEMSRQRLRTSLFEASMVTCPHCGGSGFVRSTESTVLHVLRAIEEEGIRGRAARLTVHVPTAVALYLLNQKREGLHAIEQRYEMHVQVFGDDDLVPPDYRLDIDVSRAPGEAGNVVAIADHAATSGGGEDESADADGGGRKRRRRRRRKRSDADGGEAETAPVAAEAAPDEETAEAAEATEATESADDGEDPEAPRKRRRRGRRGGRRKRAANGAEAEELTADGEAEPATGTTVDATDTTDATNVGDGVDDVDIPPLPGADATAGNGAEAPADLDVEVEADSDVDAPVPEIAHDSGFDTGVDVVSAPMPDDDGDAPLAVADPAPLPAFDPEPAVAAVDEAGPEMPVAEAEPVEDEMPEPAAMPLAAVPAVEDAPSPYAAGIEAPEAIETPAVTTIEPESVTEEKADDRPKRRGWWQRRG